MPPSSFQINHARPFRSNHLVSQPVQCALALFTRIEHLKQHLHSPFSIIFTVAALLRTRLFRRRFTTPVLRILPTSLKSSNMSYSYATAKAILTEGEKDRILALYLSTDEPNVCRWYHILL